jgi:gliding motility-associated-like protein
MTATMTCFVSVSGTDYCENVPGDRKAVTVTVNPTATAVDITADGTTVCYNTDASLTASATDVIINPIFKWYDSQDPTATLLSAGATYTIPALTATMTCFVSVSGTDYCENAPGDRKAVTVTVNPFPQLSVINSDIEICYGSAAIPKASSTDVSALLTWYSDKDYTTTIISANSFKTAILTEDTMFYISAELAEGCVVYDSVTVTVHPLPQLSADNLEVCYGAKAILEASSMDNGVSFTWYSDMNFTDTVTLGKLFETDMLTADTVFYVTSESTKGCISNNSTEVTVNALPQLSVNALEVCCGLSVIPKASSADENVSFKWYNDKNFTNAISSDDSFETSILMNDTVFYVIASSAKGCISEDSVEVTVHFLPQLSVNDIEICSGSLAIPKASSSGENVSFEWYADNDYTNAVIFDDSFETGILTADTVFYVAAISNTGCQTRDSVEVAIIMPPVVVAMDDYHLCYGEEITLTTLQSDGLISWDISPLTVSPKYEQQYIVTASRSPCPDASDTVTIAVGDSLYILQHDLPDYTVNKEYAQQLTANAISPTFTVINGNLPSGLVLYLSGMISGINTTNEYQPITFTVQVEDIYKCTATEAYTIAKEIFVPQVFTPNGDGINDVFMKGHKVVIFDRLGINLFIGDDGWDGTQKGKPVAQDIYFYLLYYEDNKGKATVKDGYIGVNR